MQMLAASVIIPTYNRLDELDLTLSSLMHQKSNYEFEVIVADDGSSENTKSIVDRYIGRQNIRYCYQEDKGFRAGAARNMGIKLADGEICIFVDNGVILHSEAIENHVNAHRNESNPCVVLGYVYGFDVAKSRIEDVKAIIDQNSPDEAISILHKKKVYDVREKDYQELGSDLHKWPAPFLICWTCNLSVRKNVLVKVGMFDDAFVGWGAEDIDLGVSLFKNNVKFILARDVRSIHVPHEKSHRGDTNLLRERVNFEKKLNYILKKHPIHEVEMWKELWTIYVNNPQTPHDVSLTINLNKFLLEEMSREK